MLELGHYSRECKKPKKEDVPKGEGQKTPESQGPTAAAAEYASEDDGAWSVLPVELDWFEMAVAETEGQNYPEKVLADEIPVRDWFYEVAEGDNESEDKGASSGGVSVDGFDSDASEEVFVRDLSVVGHVWPACDGNFEGADRSSSKGIMGNR